MEHIILTLSNGKRVANFSSPHAFTFTDGNVLPAVSNEDSLRLAIKFIETPMDSLPIAIKGDIALEFELTPEVDAEISYWMDQYMNHNAVDVVLVPLPMLTALYQIWSKELVIASPFRAIRMEDRLKKLVSIDKQCL